jgi:hypothetical protein
MKAEPGNENLMRLPLQVCEMDRLTVRNGTGMNAVAVLLYPSLRIQNRLRLRRAFSRA